MKCSNCDEEIPEDEPLKFAGRADVKGTTTLKRFRKEGIEWTPHNSWKESVICPNCGRVVPLNPEEWD